jgi:uncharacterized membrane protein YeaQ/YmgE (transglycosylase-associated protein family)
MNRIWSKVGKILGSLFLFGGSTVSVGLLVGILASQVAGGWLAFLWILMVFFGLVPALLGGWILYSSFQAEQRAIREQFFQLLAVSQGRLSVLDFATASRLEPAIARRHMDIWAKEFDADFEVNERGDIYYIFATKPLALPESNLQVLTQAIRQWLKSTV